MDASIVGAAIEYHSAAGDKHRSPIEGLCIGMGPDTLTGVHIPRLNFAEVVRTGGYAEVEARSHKARASIVLDWHSGGGRAGVLDGRHIDHPRLGTERDGRPILAARQG